MKEFEMEMVNQCLTYSKKLVDSIYIYGCCEGRVISANCFFQKGDKMYRLHQLHAINPSIDVSRKAMSDLLHVLVKIIKDMKQFCQINNYNMPKEIKMVYHVGANTAKSDTKFTNQLDLKNFIGCAEIFDRWFDEVKAKVEGAF